MKLPDIDGEVVEKGHEKWIEILSFSWGATQTGSFGAGRGGGAGKVNMQDFHFVHAVDKSSPKLMLAACSGKHIPSALIGVSDSSTLPPVGDASASNRAGGDYLIIKLKDVLVSSVRPGANSSTDDQALEAVSLEFDSISAEYRAADGETTQGSCG
jgi:type VI secretion system secreted protein Hcp